MKSELKSRLHSEIQVKVTRKKGESRKTKIVCEDTGRWIA